MAGKWRSQRAAILDAGTMTRDDPRARNERRRQLRRPYSARPSSLLSQPDFVLGFIGPLPAPCNPVRIWDIQMSANRDQQSWARDRPASCESGTWGSEAARSCCATIRGNDDEACNVPWIRRQSRLRRGPKDKHTILGSRRLLYSTCGKFGR